MKKKSTLDALVKDRLSATAVPDWASGWKALEPLLGESAAPRPAAPRLWKRAAVAAAVLAGGLLAWRVFSPRTAAPAREVVVMPERSGLRFTSQSLTPERKAIPATGPARREPLPDIVSPARSMEEPFSARFPLPVCTALPLRLRPGAICTPDSLETPVPVPLRAGGQIASTPASPASSARRFVSGWHLSVGLGANGGSSFGNPSSNYNPLLKGSTVDIYPSAFVSGTIGPRLSLGVGLAVASPVDVRRDVLDQTVSYPLRAMAAGASSSEDNISLTRLYYADVPVVLRYHLGKRFSVGSGLQLSILEKVIGEKQRVDYDRYGAMMAADPPDPRPRDLTRADATSGTVRPLDFRVLVGVHYRLGSHWDASLQYQYGLTDISSDKALLQNQVNRNTVLRGGLSFLIR